MIWLFGLANLFLKSNFFLLTKIKFPYTCINIKNKKKASMGDLAMYITVSLAT